METLKKVYIETYMVTGDNIYTSIKVAKDTGFFSSDNIIVFDYIDEKI